jgi:ATP-dependent DNA ligase
MEYSIIDNHYVFPTINYTDKNDRTRFWSIQARLVLDSIDSEYKVNWVVDHGDEVDARAFTEDVVIQVWTEYGIVDGKQTRSVPTIYTNKPLQKVLQECYTKYLSIKKKTVTMLYTPMLAKVYSNYKDKIVYPIYIQAKLDGIRCISYMDEDDGVKIYTRQKKEFAESSTMNNIRHHLMMDLFDDAPEGVYFDGELYIHGKSFHEISSIVRNSNSTEQLYYYIYDCFIPDSKMLTQKERLNILNRLPTNNEYIRIVKTITVNDEEELQNVHKENLLNKYEGTILRNIDGCYSHGRTMDLLKMKDFFDDEFTVVDYTCGKGKDKGAVVWICETVNGELFNVVPIQTYEERCKAYRECQNKFDTEFKGRQMTIRYAYLSENGIPQHLKGVDWRFD